MADALGAPFSKLGLKYGSWENHIGNGFCDNRIEAFPGVGAGTLAGLSCSPSVDFREWN
jgi:hypothetical protein